MTNIFNPDFLKTISEKNQNTIKEIQKFIFETAPLCNDIINFMKDHSYSIAGIGLHGAVFEFTEGQVIKITETSYSIGYNQWIKLSAQKTDIDSIFPKIHFYQEILDEKIDGFQESLGFFCITNKLLHIEEMYDEIFIQGIDGSDKFFNHLHKNTLQKDFVANAEDYETIAKELVNTKVFTLNDYFNLYEAHKFVKLNDIYIKNVMFCPQTKKLIFTDPAT